MPDRAGKVGAVDRHQRSSGHADVAVGLVEDEAMIEFRIQARRGREGAAVLMAAAAGIATKLGNHSFRATGITAYLKNGGTLEKAAQMANHASTRTTQLYDCRREELSLDEVERIRV